jgi:hypothetical protein
MMDCDMVVQLLGAYVDGEVQPTQRDEIESHVSVCGACRTELREIEQLAVALAGRDPVSVPPGLWGAVEQRLEPLARRRSLFLEAAARRPVLALAASIVIVVGLGLFGLPWGGDRASQVRAATVDFSVLLDDLQHDAVVAFDKFLAQYKATPTTLAEARRYAPALDFDLPQVLPGGFQLQATYMLRFGDDPGVAGRYVRNGEFLGVVFHAPVLREYFGTHRDRECVVGKHRGHKVPVGEWSLVHLTDATTCHCLLSRLNEDSEIPAVLAAVAPSASTESESVQHNEHQHNP